MHKTYTTQTLGFVVSSDLMQQFRHPISESATEQLAPLMGHIEHLIPTTTQDEALWKWTTNGIFSVKSAYKAIKDEPTVATDIPRIWATKAPPRFRVFAWLMIKNRILTVDNLRRKGFILVNRCYMCEKQEETVRHLLFECETARLIQTIMITAYQIRMPRFRQDTHPLLSKDYTAKEKSLFLIAQFVIWRDRCAKVFRDSKTTIPELLAQIREQWQLTSGTYQ